MKIVVQLGYYEHMHVSQLVGVCVCSHGNCKNIADHNLLSSWHLRDVDVE